MHHHDHEHSHDHDHAHIHAHDTDHTHTDAHSHEHPHEHSHEHVHQHSHAHDHTHGDGHTHSHAHESAEAPHSHDGGHDSLLKSKEEAAAFLQYTLHHNAHHDEELSGLVHSLQHLAMDKQASEVASCIGALKEVNTRLEAVLAALK